MGGIPEFAGAIPASEAWVDDLKRRLGWEHSDRAYLALLATLHALRDHLPADDAVRLGTGLPPLLRGFYYEGWHPRARSDGQGSREAFFTRISEGVHRDLGIDAEQVSRVILSLLSERLPSAEVEEIRAASPAAIHGLWPD